MKHDIMMCKMTSMEIKDVLCKFDVIAKIKVHFKIPNPKCLTVVFM